MRRGGQPAGVHSVLAYYVIVGFGREEEEEEEGLVQLDSESIWLGFGQGS